MSALWITGGRVIDPANQLDAIADVLVQDGRITAVAVRHENASSLNAPADAEVIDATGLIVCPASSILTCRCVNRAMKKTNARRPEQPQLWQAVSQPSRLSRTHRLSWTIARRRSLSGCRPSGLAIAESIH